MKNELKWFWDFSPSKRRAFIVDAEGFTICPPVLSRSVAAVIVGKHNHAIDVCEERK